MSDLVNAPSGLARLAGFSSGCFLLVGGLVYGFFCERMMDELALFSLAFVCASGAWLIAWSLSVMRFLRDDPPQLSRRGFDVIPDAAESDDDRPYESPRATDDR